MAASSVHGTTYVLTLYIYHASVDDTEQDFICHGFVDDDKRYGCIYNVSVDGNRLDFIYHGSVDVNIHGCIDHG